MVATSIRHGDLVFDYHQDGSVQIVRQSNATGIVLSLSEWVYLLKVSELHGMPVAPPQDPNLTVVQ